MCGLHIGGDLVLNDKEMIGIFSNFKNNESFIEIHKDHFRLKNASEKNKSFILQKRGNETVIFCSHISALKLIKRSGKQISGGR